MAIKDPLMFITIEEFKNWKGFNKLEFDDTTTPDNEIWFAISVASNNIDYLSGFTISKKWPEINPTEFTDNIQTATTHYVRFLLTKDVDYLRGQGSISQGGLTYSETNPDDPYFIPPEVFNYLRKIKEYPNIKGFNLKGIEPQTNYWFNKFISNCGEDSPLNSYIPYTNIKSLDNRTKITITHPQNMLRPVVNIDTRGINTSTTVPNFKSPKETIDITYDKENHVVNSDISNKIEERIFKDKFNKETTEKITDILNPNSKYKHIDYEYNPSFDNFTDNTLIPKKYADEKLDNKLDKIDNEIKDSSKSVVKAINNCWIAVSTLSVRKQNIEDADLQTTDKTIVGAINELKNRNVPVDENRIFNNKDDKDNTTRLVKEIIKTTVGGATLIYRRNPYVSDDLDIPHKKYVDDEIKKLNIIKWNSVGTKESNIKINYEFKINTLYRIAYSWNTNDTGAIKYLIFKYMGDTTILDDYIYDINKTKVLSNFVHLIVSKNNNIALVQVGNTFGKLISLEEAESKNTRNFIDNNIIPITPPTPPTPCPCPKWKDVAISLNGSSIIYQLKPNTFYKIFYNLNHFNPSTFGKTPTQTIEIFWQEIPSSSYWVCYIPSIRKNTYINILNNNVNTDKIIKLIRDDGYIWKLQELQE